jgi:hypothetical protein
VAPEIVGIEKFGVLTSGLRNIRCQIDGGSAVFDFIPEALLPPDPAQITETNSILRRLQAGASLVVEGPTMLRLEIHGLLGMAVDADIDVDLYGGLHNNWRDAPKLADKKTYYPLLEIRNSPWKAQLPDWRRRDDPEVRHFRMISAECSFDLLGELLSGSWIANLQEH